MFYRSIVDDPALVPQQLLFLVPQPLHRTHLWISSIEVFTSSEYSSGFLVTYRSRQYDAEAQQAEWQADGDLSGWGHGAFTTVGWTGGAQLLLLTKTITTN